MRRNNDKVETLMDKILSLNPWIFSLILILSIILIFIFSDFFSIICTCLVGISLYGLLGTWSRIPKYGWKMGFSLLLGPKWTMIFFVMGLISVLFSLIKIYW